MLNVLDIFSGIGGFSLGLEATGGFRTVAFCEPDRYCRAVLAKHWPRVARFKDVRYLTADKLRRFPTIHVICGGFPCQDISQAGNKVGIDGARSGLWSEFYRLVGELRPVYALVENVSALLNRGLERVLGDLAALGYDAEWHCIPASYIGAPHRRDRIWIVAYTNRSRSQGWLGRILQERARQRIAGPRGALADSEGERCGEAWQHCERPEERSASGGEILSDANGGSMGRPTESRSERGQWSIEPDVGRVADGVRYRVHRLRALGNAVVPQIPSLIGQAILEAERGEVV